MNLSIIIPIIVGGIAGAIINYISDALPKIRQIDSPIVLDENIFTNIRKYLFFQNFTDHAKKNRVWLTQIIILGLSVYTWIEPPKLGYALGMLLMIYLAIVFVIDMEHRLILHPTSIVGSILTLILGTVAHGFVPTLLGGLAGFVILLLFYLFGVLFAKMRAKRMVAQGQEPDDEEALGAGDVILATILGFLVGWPLIWFCILMSILLGGIISFLLIVWLIVSGKYNKNALMMFIPYGPYFIVSASLLIYFPSFVQLFLPK